MAVATSTSTVGPGVRFASVNELATLTNTFLVGVTPTDPTLITLVVTDPTGTAVTYTFAGAQITRTSAGVYTKDITCATAGTWQAQWDGTGTASDTTVITWEVQEIQLGRLYCTVEALKSRIGLDPLDTDDDAELHAACFAASRAVENYCERTFWRSASTEVRTFATCDPCVLKLPEFNDLVSVTTFASDASGDGVYETTWSASDYQLLPSNLAGPERKPYTSIRAITGRQFPVILTSSAGRDDRIQITGVFGWPSVPYAVRQAAQLMAAELFRRKDAPLGVTGEGEFTVQVGQNRLARNLLDPYRRNVILIR